MLPVICTPAIIVPAPDYAIQTAVINTDMETWETGKLFEHGVGLLKKGRLFESAITALKITVQRQPEDLSYRQALGCTYAARYASLALALHNQSVYERAVKEYEERRAAWDKAQKDPQNRGFGSSAPEAPIAPRTPDDGKLFTLKREKANGQLTRLRQESIRQFDKSSELAKPLPADKQAAEAYVRG